jgi:peptidyl-prolyl cis-trans isomerase D
MLSYMRKHARSWFIKVLLGAVIVVFIFFYGFSLRDNDASLIAEVNGLKIAQRDFQRQFDRLLDAQRSRRSDLTPEQRKALRETALESLIDQVLLLEQADQWRMTVAESEVKEYVRGIPAFQDEGQFSLLRFQQYLRLRAQTEREFFAELSRDLRIQKVENLIRDGAWVAEDEVETVYRVFNERLTLHYVALSAEPFVKEISPSPEEIQAHFQDHPGDYRIPEMVRVEFLRFDPKTYLPQIEVTAKDLEQRYGLNPERWKEAKQVLGSQILIRTSEQDDDKTRMKALEKAEELLKRLQSGEDFATLAKEHSQDTLTAPRGGSLGWKAQGELPEAVGRALFEEMAPGQLSERPVKSSQGFHVLKLEELRAERIKPLEEVRETLEREIGQEKARQQASDLAEEAYLTIFKGSRFQDAAKQYQIEVQKTELFPFKGPVKDLPVGESFRKAAFALKEKDDFSEVVQDGASYYILLFLERTQSREPTLAEVEDRVRLDVQRSKAVERARIEAQELVQRLRDGSALSSEAEKAGWKLISSQPLSRLTPPAGLPLEMVQAAFALPAGSSLLPEAYRQGDRYLVGEIKERTPADPKGLEEQKGLYRSLLLRDRRDGLYRDWLAALRARSEIKTFRAYQDLL